MGDHIAPVITRCGYRCDLCLAYRPNVQQNPDNQQKLSDGWFQYFGFRIAPENILCDGCMEDQPVLIDKSCPVKPCVIAKQIENCSYCEEYICEKLQERNVDFDQIRSQHANISEDDYQCFIRPYENQRRLNALRSLRKSRTG